MQPVIQPQLVILPSERWRQELALELVRLGLGGEDPDLVAAAVLRRILGRAGWPRRAILVAEESPVEAVEGSSR